MTDVEQAVLRENWQHVKKLLKSVNGDTSNRSDPIFRLVKGHACLATNDNDLSMELFLSVTSEEDLEQCQEWARDFVRRNSKRAISHYFLGDVMARSGKYADAVKAFNHAAHLEPNHRLVLNARAVAHARSGDLDAALTDLCQAAELPGPPLADVSANLGALGIQQQEGAQAALEDYDRALHISDDFALALYGRGCIRAVLGKWDGSWEDIGQALEQSDVAKAKLTSSLGAAYDRILLQKEKAAERALAGYENPQMAIDAAFKKLDSGANPEGLLSKGPRSPLNEAYNAVERSGFDTVTVEHLKQRIAGYVAKNPEKAEATMRQLGRIEQTQKWNVRVGKSLSTVASETRSLNQRIEAKMDASAAGAAAGGPAAGVGRIDAGLQSSMENRITQTMKPGVSMREQRMHVREQGIGHLQDIQKSVSKQTGSLTKEQGFKTVPEDAAWDGGDWPFEPLYGLLYEAPVQAAPQAEE